eukprot:scaffold4936_cov96-Isochrysis_galbana.AAC.2
MEVCTTTAAQRTELGRAGGGSGVARQPQVQHVTLHPRTPTPLWPIVAGGPVLLARALPVASLHALALRAAALPVVALPVVALPTGALPARALSAVASTAAVAPEGAGLSPPLALPGGWAATTAAGVTQLGGDWLHRGWREGKHQRVGGGEGRYRRRGCGRRPRQQTAMARHHQPPASCTTVAAVPAWARAA